MKTANHFISGSNLLFRIGVVCGAAVLWVLLPADSGWGQIDAIGPPSAYEAPQYVPPPPRKSHVHLVDNGDGTLTETTTGLMWARADSYADLGKCLNWYQSRKYVPNLRTGGYDDWRMPTMRELGGIFDNTKENAITWDHQPEYPLALDEKFADGAAYWYWSADYEKTKMTDCCALALYFVTGIANTRRLTVCSNGGVRAVRGTGKDDSQSAPLWEN